MENKIEWYDLKHELIEFDPEERMEVYLCYGQDSRGIEYSGLAYFFCDELDRVTEIEPC